MCGYMQVTSTSKSLEDSHNYPHPKPASEAITDKAVTNICGPIKTTNFLTLVLI